MKIGLIGHGALPIPPTDHGAVEGTIWQRKLHLERLGHTVDIANTRAIQDVIWFANTGGYDFVHCHCEHFALECVRHLRVPFAVTTHFGGLYNFSPAQPDEYRGFQYLFADTLLAPATVVLSEHIRCLYLSCGYQGYLRILRNAVEAADFRFAPAAGNGRAICLGAIHRRKRQRWLAEIARGRLAVDFVGPQQADEGEGLEEHETARYLGVWDKPTLYGTLTDYSCLVLLSTSEGAPKVVLEALAAGLSLVVTEAGAANLAPHPFITILPDAEQRPDVIAEAIQTAIDRNARYRDDIRRYALEHFDYPVVIADYLQIIGEVRDHFRARAGDLHETALRMAVQGTA